MNDPLYDQVPHMVPHKPDWPVGRYEKLVLLACVLILVVAIIFLVTP